MLRLFCQGLFGIWFVAQSDGALVAVAAKAHADACERKTWAIAAPLPPPGAAAGKFVSQSQLLHILSAFVRAPQTLPLRVVAVDGVGRIRIPCDSIAPEARDAIESLAAISNGLEVLQAAKTKLLDSGLFNQLRGTQPRSIEIPATARLLAAQIFGVRAQRFQMKRFGDWQALAGRDSFDLRIPSRVKARTRAIYSANGYSIALTLEPQFLSAEELAADALVLETEVMVRRQFEDANGNHNHDFFVYDSDGELAKCSSFFSGSAIVIGSAPQTCMSCHYQVETRAFGVDAASYAGRPIENWESLPVESLPIIHSCPKKANSL